MKYDVVIIGGGPAGYTAANKASENGLKTLLIEKDKVGGTCLNRGCIPMKSIIESARIYNSHLESELYGIKYSDVSFDYSLINSRRNDVVNTLRTGVEKSLKTNKVEVVYGKAKIISKNEVECEGVIYETDNIIIATGSIVAIPPIEGIDYALTSNDVLETDYSLPESLIIIGGGVIGVEIASALSSFNTKVTILEMANNLLPSMDKEIGQRLAMFFKKKGIDVNCGCNVKTIKKENDNYIVEYLDSKNEMKQVIASQVIVATGRKANIDGLFDDNLGLQVNRGIVADENGKTNIDNIYVIGDARSNNIQLAHMAEAQGENIIDIILNKPLTNDISVIPSGVYSDPEIAFVGISEDKLKQDNVEYKSKKYLTGANGKCLIENSESGFVKIITVDDVIVAGSIIAPHATELIAELAIAVEKKMTMKQFGEVVHPHPTISEMLWNVSK